MNSNTIELQAPAKVNYRLDVLSRRDDGYHNLRMIMQRVELCDTIRLTISDIPGIRVICGREGVPDGPGNIAWKAANEILKLAPMTTGVDITITKRIPVAAGLGGGSSDAAAVLMGLNDLLGLKLSIERLMKIGVTLGADVPFFIFGKTALAEGIGEILTPIERIPEAWLVLVNPKLHVSTAWVYKNLQLTSRADTHTMPHFFDTIAEVCSILSNDLETVTIGSFPVIQEIKDRLIVSGASASLMSGSGPTVFGIFEDESIARRVAETIAIDSGWFAKAVRTL
jgi:4-diphosphocytidyl-2-C-methyl-D-erythritol kinase